MIALVNDFRTTAVRAGGEGATLAPIYHTAPAADRVPVAILNMGGAANVTLTAFDTGNPSTAKP